MDSGFGRLVVAKHDLQLQEVPQILNIVEVNASPPDQEKCPVLSNAANLAIGQR
jgi:hypothetical protein